MSKVINTKFLYISVDRLKLIDISTVYLDLMYCLEGGTFRRAPYMLFVAHTKIVRVMLKRKKRTIRSY